MKKAISSSSAATATTSLATASSSSSLSLSMTDIEQKVTSRASKLMEYLELNIERILNDCAPDSLQLYNEKKIRNEKEVVEVEGVCDSNGNNNNNNSIDNKSKSNVLSSLGGQWAQELRWIRWVPVFVQPPPPSSSSLSSLSSSSILHQSNQINILPWSSRVHCRPLASPSQCCSLNNLSLCSATSRICMMEVKSDLLLEVLGWNRPISGKNVFYFK
jgi:hypothetical protein